MGFRVGERDPRQDSMGSRLTFDLSRPGRMGADLPPLDVPEAELPPKDLLRHDLRLPEMSQNEAVRYFLALSRLNYSVDTGFYPLGSCTMKYNPKVNEEAARLPGFSLPHPLQEQDTVQGALALLHRLQSYLCEVTGMDACSLVPAAGAQGELAGMLMVKAYLRDRGEEGRRRVLVPDSAHGTNPASAAMCGFQVVTVPSDREGNVDMGFLEQELDGSVAAMMLTIPSTLGLFEPNIARIAEMLHRHGALLYGDGANQNAFLGRARFGDMGFDVVHLNLHKTFSTPHGGGGPGAGPVCCKSFLAPYLPAPVVEERDGSYRLARPERSVGKLTAFWGNFGVLVRAYAYIRALGAEGLRSVAENAVINANYVRTRLKGVYHLPYDRTCLHEVVFSAARQRAKGVKALDIAKRLIDYGFHPPTIYFPLIVPEALMIEPTETESRESLDAFCEAMLAIAREAEEEPELVQEAPHTAPLRRLDEATAARRPVLRWQPPEER
jgi:glycine dehydrogenase subunit 2